MMRKSMIHRAERPERLLAKRAAKAGRIQFIWQNWGESNEAVQARIRALIERGDLSENDQITTFRWHEPEGGWPQKDDRWANQNVHAVAARAAERAKANSTQATPSPEPLRRVRAIDDIPDPTTLSPEYPP
jgi:hypothetical protein